MTYALHCAGCGDPFEAKRPHARYCSDACRARHWKGTGSDRPHPDGERVLRVVKGLTDCERLGLILRLRGKKGIHSHEIRKLAISGNPSQRIADLEEQGFEIEHRREHKGKRPGVRYVLVAEPKQTLAEAA